MFSVLLYMLLPVVYLFHDAEEMFMRRKWERRHHQYFVDKYPKLRTPLCTLKALTQLEYGIVIFEQLIFLTIAVVLGIYADITPLCALFWGFGIHLVIHILHAIAFRMYLPGVLTSSLLLPYFITGVYDLFHQYTPMENLMMAVGGFCVVFLNLGLMYWLMKKFSDLD